MDVKIIEGPALPNAMPGYKTSYDISPHAGVKGFDDSSWPTLEPKQLLDRRGGGKVSFLWYRTNLTMPAKIGNFDTANAKAVLTAYVDDYAEVWVNGEMPRRVGITSPATIQGFNIPNRVVIADTVKAGDKVEIAIFGINGPISRAAELRVLPPGVGRILQIAANVASCFARGAASPSVRSHPADRLSLSAS